MVVQVVLLGLYLTEPWLDLEKAAGVVSDNAKDFFMKAKLAMS
eukprot:CAMPEP_0113583664 /NCGR_PEP_ID=MMETSP0015_2-20120614/32649_1 /TAXON_ID=2838 /ORGANISM="Odontella" /LENGTH=42 /DNA_ID=CAMNT_0000488579 /DNA_START=1563 /DNA_END=1691 /DNA_ORIENTATION=+ /assembly_acc=CAM_ASM_000160